MSHDYHDDLPGFSPDQLLHAGCGECEARAEKPDGGIGHLDPARFAHAWWRASVWKGNAGNLPDLDGAEIRMLAALWAVQVQLEQLGIPIGALPVSAWLWVR